MKVIELLTKIANGEEVPTFRYLDRTLRYNKAKECFDDINDVRYCRTGFGCNGLNDEVEIIEEDKKIKKIPYQFSLDYIDSKLDSYTKEEINNTINHIYDKINEIIDYINKEK